MPSEIVAREVSPPSMLQAASTTASPIVQALSTPTSTSSSKRRQTTKAVYPFLSNAQANVQIISFEQLQTLMQHNPDTIRIINFWATTCRPCIQEMPDFERLYREYATARNTETIKHKPVQLVFVSVDFLRDVEKKVIPFVKKHGITAKVVCLGVPKSADIDAIDAEWTGSLPATLILGTARGERLFFEKSMSYEELKESMMKFVSR